MGSVEVQTGFAKSRSTHLVIVTTTALVTTAFFSGQIARLRKEGFRVTLICSPGPQTESVAAEGGAVITIPMERDISPFKDLRSLWKLWRILRRIRPDIINVGTPKAGLLGGIAAWMSGVPCRIYTLHGLRFETARGWKRRLLILAERVACRAAQHVRCVSSSLRQRAIELGVLDREKAYVVGAGSANGIDCERFRPVPERLTAIGELRRSLRIPPAALVIGFAGRFTRDKGFSELNGAYRSLKQIFPELRLLLLGEFEDGDPVDPAVRSQLEADSQVHFAGWVPDTAPYYRLMDVLVLPTYREGFPNVALEGQASSVPVVTTAATGARDSVLPGITGLLVAPQDQPALTAALRSLLENATQRRLMGDAGAEWVRAQFQQEAIWDALIADYNRILRETSLQQGLRRTVKSALDRVAAALLMLLLSPVLGVVALLVRWKLGAPVLFRQPCAGLRTETFELLKFRALTNRCDAQGGLLPDEARLTRLGRRLRALNLDELPQLWNVLRGELSLVGPRPLAIRYLERLSPEQARRHRVMPGITGWAQVNGRNAIDWEQKFAYDCWYVDHWRLSLDFNILLLTLWRVLTGRSVSQVGHATIPEFIESEPPRGGESASALQPNSALSPSAKG